MIVAAPPLFTAADPMKFPPSSKFTTPFVTGVLPLATVAVKVTVSPEVELAEEALSVVVVPATTGAAGSTATTTAFESDAEKFTVPV